MYPASYAARYMPPTRMEFAHRIQNNLVRSWRLSMIWFFRSFSVIVGPLRHTFRLTFLRRRQSHDPICLGGSGDRSWVNSAMGEQRPNNTRHFVGQRHPHQHRRLAAQHPIKPGFGYRNFRSVEAATELAPMINKRRKVRSPILDVRPRRSFPPLDR